MPNKNPINARPFPRASNPYSSFRIAIYRTFFNAKEPIRVSLARKRIIVFAAYNSSMHNECTGFCGTRFFFLRKARGIIGTPGAPGIRGMERGCRHRNEQARSRIRSGGTKLSHCVLIHRSLLHRPTRAACNCR